MAPDCKALVAKSKSGSVEREEKRLEEAGAQGFAVEEAQKLVDRSLLGVEQAVDFQLRIDCLVGEAEQFGIGNSAWRVLGVEVEVEVDRSLEVHSLWVEAAGSRRRRAEVLADTVPDQRDWGAARLEGPAEDLEPDSTSAEIEDIHSEASMIEP